MHRLLKLFRSPARRRLFCIALGALALALHLLSRTNSTAVESVYGLAIYRVFRTVWDNTLAYSPVPLIWVVLLLLLWRIWSTLVQPLRRRNWTLRSATTGFLATAGLTLFLFYLMWGFNYQRPQLEERFGIDASIKPGALMLSEEFDRSTKELVALSVQIPFDPIRLNSAETKARERAIRTTLEEALRNLDFPVFGRVRGRILKPKGILLVLNTAGIYIPFSGEGHIDGGLHPVQLPFTMAHEMAHGYGVTDEGSCNFLAYLACAQSEDMLIRFSGLLGYWRYVAFEFRRDNPEAYQQRYDQLPEVIKITLEDIRRNNDSYPELFPQLRNQVYDSYLKSQGISEGLRSYNRVVTLVMLTRQQKIPGTEHVW